MLITNFAAGELSETLFGRTDLPQYYQGVSFLENFEVIPTGGIERRNGTKRILTMEREGRIIPFILSREESFLLYLLPQVVIEGATVKARIRIYRNGVQQGSDVVDSAAVPLPRTLAEINEVQYAQNYNTMVLVHENYAPLRIRLLDTTSQVKAVEVLKLPIARRVRLQKAGEEADKQTYNPVEFDPQYAAYLATPGNYPRSVTFFGGRLIFAGTKNNPQRIFASKVGTDESGAYDFSTYNLFLTFSREYVSLEGKFDTGVNTFTPSNMAELSKLIENYDRYFVASLFFPEGTRIAGVTNGVMSFTRDAAGLEISDAEMATFLAWKSAREAQDVWSTEYIIYSLSDSGSLVAVDISKKVSYRIGQFKIAKYQSGFAEPTETSTYDLGTIQQVKEFIENKDTFESWVKDIIGTEVSRPAVVTSFINAFYNFITQTMKYPPSPSPTFPYLLYGSPYQIYQQILGADVGPGGGMVLDTYLSFYTVKITEDRYPTPDDGFTFEIASDMSDAIKWIGQNKNVLVGTETAEWVIPAGVTATSVQAILNSRYGSDRIQGTSVGDAMCFFQSGRKALVEYYIPQQDNNFRANNMALLSKNMLHEAAAFDFDFISAPYTKIFVSREDGIVVSLLYERSTGTFAWGRIRTGGIIKSVATVPGPSGYDDVYLIVERPGGYFLEMLAERRRSPDAPDAGVFLDSYGPWTGNAAGYTGEAVIYDELNNQVYPLSAPPPVGPRRWIGYPYRSRVRSMPVLANNQMKQNIIKTLNIRLNDSYLPRVKSLPNGQEDTITRPEPYDGIVQVPFPGVWDRDVFFELIHDKPTRCRVLSVNAEAN